MSSTYAEPLEVIERGLDELAAIDPGYRTTDSAGPAGPALADLIADARRSGCGCSSTSDDIAEATGARSTAHWLADATRDDIGPVRRLSVLAEALDERWTEVGAALASGAVNVPQARVIVEALDALPDSLDAETRAKAEAHLIGEAGHYGPPRAAGASGSGCWRWWRRRSPTRPSTSAWWPRRSGPGPRLG